MGYYNNLTLNITRPRYCPGCDCQLRPNEGEVCASCRAPSPAPVLTVAEAATCAALERLAEEHAASARAARLAGEREDAKFSQRAANAFVKALGLYRVGLRPDPTDRGGWLLPSQRPGEPPHLLRMDGDWVCTCVAGTTMHWATAMMIGIEAGQDCPAQGLVGIEDVVTAPEPTPMDLGRRLAQARAQAALNECFA